MAMAVSCQSLGRTSTCPSWLQSALADIEQRIQTLALFSLDSSSAAAVTAGDSFAARAENYYQKRPQLISLLHDLHFNYLHLAERYSQSLLKLSASSTNAASEICLSDDDEYNRPPLSTISDADSSISFTFTPSPSSSVDPVFVELTLALVERNVLLEETTCSDRREHDSSRKMEIQRSLLEVMEAERVVLLAENERLEYRRMKAEEEAGYVRMRAAAMGKRLAMMREEQQWRVCALGKRVEALERKERELVRREREREKAEAGADLEKLREENRRLARKKQKKIGRWSCVGRKGRRKGCLMLWESCVLM